MKNEVLKFFWEVLETFIFAVLIVVPIHRFVFQPYLVKGDSMNPNFENGDYLIVDEITYRFRDPKRGEVVVFKFPKNEKLKFIKRIIGLPGEKVKILNGKIKIEKDGQSFYLNEEKYLLDERDFGEYEFKLGENEYLVLGDNRLHSFDSRFFGPIKKEKILGRVILRLWPLNSVAAYLNPVY